MERALLARHDPVIDLSLAQNCAEPDVFLALFEKGQSEPSDESEMQYLKALRLACMINENQGGLLHSFPTKPLGQEKTERLILESGDEEVLALFTNPRMDDDLLEGLFKNTGAFANLDDKRRQGMIYAAADNPRITMDKSDEHGPDLSLVKIQDGIIEMLRSVPTTRIASQIVV